jgi:cell division protein FtsI (penicillin-binding protein 3)
MTRMSFAAATPAGAAAGAVRQRIALLAVTFCSGFALLGASALSVALLRDYDAAKANAQAQGEAMERRAEIVDRNGALLATSITDYTLFANPREVWDPLETARAVRRVFPELSEGELVTKLTDKKKWSVDLKTGLTPRQRQAVLELGQAGLDFVERERRVYPRGSLAAHVLGYTSTDGKGIAGIEAGLDEEIRRRAREGGTPVRLSLDMRVQHVVEAELGAIASEQRAKGGVGGVLDATTGEFLALTSWPTFDPNHQSRASADAKFNRAVTALFEMGSTFKAFTVAMGLEDGVVTPESGYDASRPITVGGRVITDFHAQNRYLTIPEILSHSSNIGTARLAMDVGAERHKAFLRNLGLLEAAPLETAEGARPMVPKQWTQLSTATISYGHGVSVSAVSTMAAFGATVNGGAYIAPTLLVRERDQPIQAHPVMKPETSRQMVTLLREVVTDGTGGKAEAEGYEVAGKTGTAEKPKLTGPGYDSNRRVSSFIGVFPAREPRYVVFVLLDEPQGSAQTHGVATAGWTAAPTVSRIVTRAAPMLGVAPIRQFAQAATPQNAAGATP